MLKRPDYFKFYRDSKTFVKSVQPFKITNRKWNVRNAVEDSGSFLNMKRVFGTMEASTANVDFHPQRR